MSASFPFPSPDLLSPVLLFEPVARGVKVCAHLFLAEHCPGTAGEYFRRYQYEIRLGIRPLYPDTPSNPTLFDPNPATIQPPIPRSRARKPLSTGNDVHAPGEYGFNRAFRETARFKGHFNLHYSGLLAGHKKGVGGLVIRGPDRLREGHWEAFFRKNEFVGFGGKRGSHWGAIP